MASAGLHAYREVLRLVRRLPADARPYYAKYARENFVNYRDLSADDDLAALLRRAHAHSAWVLSKVIYVYILVYCICIHHLLLRSKSISGRAVLQYSIDEGEAGRLKELYNSH
ncbi:hypothetical protein PR202_gb00880 [Eleusine coracana subsp. coracana]|uniref:Complex 1 LYR protein domain-containing protein n=1 Tax=Eleusine coracana subsp. coracana TaxID=191504 RepID=A0AAV5DSZ7_ELECO|nr:hypothetical protein PR202_gb00880 [Eleusine coracana subsp. coracana]